MNPEFRQILRNGFLEANAARFDPEWNLCKQVWQGPGYHSRVPDGTEVHLTVVGLSYALALLDQNDPASLARAEAIFDKVLGLQELDPAAKTYGIWPWLAEEPIPAMDPPDWNWADFCGIRLGHALAAYGDRISDPLRCRIEAALRAAAWSIFRRNVGPEYTNIAVKGGIVAALAGELLGDETLLGYAASRLRRFVDFTRSTGGFNEYNSPPYGILVLTETERGLLLVKDSGIIATLQEIHALCWENLAESLHPPTGQLGGPHARTYRNRLTQGAARTLEEGLGFPIFRPSGTEAPPPEEFLFLIPRLPCPEPIRAKIHSGGERFIRREFVHSDDPRRRRTAASWMNNEACLGSIQLDTLWTQRRPILAYWRVQEAVADLRVRLLHDGKDFASGVVRTTQEGPELVSLVSLADNKGDFHDTLDRPAGGIFSVAKLQCAIEVQGPDAAGRAEPDGSFVLRCGNWEAVVRPAFAVWTGHVINWRIEEGEGSVSLLGEVNEGKPMEIDPRELTEAAFGFHLQLRRQGEGSSAPRLTHETENGEVRLHAASKQAHLTVTCPIRPQEFL